MKLSVMMITYNHERYLAQALEGVLAQRVNFDYEIVVGEDCSTDGTREILMDFHGRHPGKIVPLLRERNMGVMRNAIETLAACRGQYLALLEGDDYWTCADKLQRQVDFLDAHPDYAICCHRAQVIAEIGKAWADAYPARAAGQYAIEDLFEGNWIPTCSVVYRWGSVGALPDWFLDMKMGDWPLHVLVARRGKINLMDESMAAYRVHAGGTWSSLPWIDQVREMAKMLRALDKHLGLEHTKAIRQTLAALCCEKVTHARQNGSRSDTARYLIEFVRNGGGWLPGQRRAFAAGAAYTLMGSWYKVFLKRKRD